MRTGIQVEKGREKKRKAKEKRVVVGYRYKLIENSDIKVGTIFLIACSIIGIIFSNDIIQIFRDDPSVIKIGSAALIWQLCTYPLNAFIMTSNMMTQTCRKPWRANILAAARRGLFFIPLIIILPRYFGLLGVEMCQSVCDSLALLLTIPVMAYTFHELKGERGKQ